MFASLRSDYEVELMITSNIFTGIAMITLAIIT